MDVAGAGHSTVSGSDDGQGVQTVSINIRAKRVSSRNIAAAAYHNPTPKRQKHPKPMPITRTITSKRRPFHNFVTIVTMRDSESDHCVGPLAPGVLASNCVDLIPWLRAPGFGFRRETRGATSPLACTSSWRGRGFSGALRRHSLGQCRER